jgi:large subunit ribosomal protein L3
VTLRDAVKKKLPDDLPRPGKFRVADGDGEAAPADEAKPAQEGA